MSKLKTALAKEKDSRMVDIQQIRHSSGFKAAIMIDKFNQNPEITDDEDEEE